MGSDCEVQASKTTKRKYEPAFKMAVALEAIRGEKTLSQVASEHGVSPPLVCEWRDRLERSADNVFGRTQQDGVRKIARVLSTEGVPDATSRRVTRLMGRMGIRPLCLLPSLSGPAAHGPGFPYLLAGKQVSFPNQAWSTDIAYVQLGGRHTCLTAAID